MDIQTDTTVGEVTVEHWLAERIGAGRTIDPETAEVFWEYGLVMDPYGIEPDLPDELRVVGRLYFARSPGSDVWVSFYDLPDKISDALWKKHRKKS